MIKYTTERNHEVTLKFNTREEMERALRILQNRFDFKITGISDYEICKWLETDMKEGIKE